jgi:uncharacterized protein YdeI (YjbR/CyaY-like superfamily)
MSDIPADFTAALKQNGLDAFFRDCTASHQREYLKWIGKAKRPETRAKRIAGAVERIAKKRDEDVERIAKKRDEEAAKRKKRD